MWTLFVSPFPHHTYIRHFEGTMLLIIILSFQTVQWRWTQHWIPKRFPRSLRSQREVFKSINLGLRGGTEFYGSGRRKYIPRHKLHFLSENWGLMEMASWSGSWNRFKKKIHSWKNCFGPKKLRVWLVALYHCGILGVNGNWLYNVLNCRETGGNGNGNST